MNSSLDYVNSLIAPRMAGAAKYLPQQFQILSGAFPFWDITLATEYEDKAEATDCWVGDWRIMLRVMNPPHRWDICFRLTPAANEWAKVAKGFGDYFLYCWQREGIITNYVLLNLARLRRAVADGLEFREWQHPSNPDKGFRCLTVKQARIWNLIEAEQT